MAFIFIIYSSQYLSITYGEVAPKVTVVDPYRGSTIPSNEIIVNGTVFDGDLNVENVEVLIHGYPFDERFDYVSANLQKINDSLEYSELFGNVTKSVTANASVSNIDYSGYLKWSVPLEVDKPGVYRILAHAEDSAGNDDWDSVIIHVPFILSDENQSGVNNSPPIRIALVNPVFTETAYSSDGFYTFYALQKSVRAGEKVFSNLSLLTPNMFSPPFPPLNETYNYDENIQDFSDINKDNAPIITLYKHIKQDLMPGVNLTVIKDQDIQNGYIFDADAENKNAYDLLVFFHEEYITQKMYNDVKNFVSNGGTVLFLDGNNMYAEVNYDQFNNTITLVEGHGWKYNGEYAERGPFERWFNDNSEWIGSNYLRTTLTANVTFGNNPFNYTHFEENFVNNPDANIILDYNATVPANSPYLGATVATYDLIFGKGKVIHMGIYSQHIMNNEKFIEFLDEIILSVFPQYNSKNQ